MVCHGADCARSRRRRETPIAAAGRPAAVVNRRALADLERGAHERARQVRLVRRAPRHRDLRGRRAAQRHEPQLREPRADRPHRRLGLAGDREPGGDRAEGLLEGVDAGAGRSGLPPRNSSSDQNARALGSPPSTQIHGSLTTSSGRTYSRAASGWSSGSTA